MTMNELKPLATEFFNSLIENGEAQAQFADAFDLWDGEPALYDGTTNAYKAVIRRYAQPINEELERISAVNSTWTKQTSVVGSENGQETINDGHTIDRSSNSTDTEQNGEQEHTTRAYPIGYTGTVDSAYTVGQDISAAVTNSSTNESTNNETYTGDSTHKRVNDTTHVTEETDMLTRAQLLDKKSILSNLIESCVFALLGGRIEYKKHCYREVI